MIGCHFGEEVSVTESRHVSTWRTKVEILKRKSSSTGQNVPCDRGMDKYLPYMWNVHWIVIYSKATKMWNL